MIPRSEFNLGDAVVVSLTGEQPFDAVVSGVHFNRNRNRIEYSVVENDRFESDGYFASELVKKSV